MNPRIICTVFILATTFDAHAHFIPHYRMDSYVLLSDDIVLCEEEDVRIKRIEHETWTEVTKVVRCRAVRAFKDDMKPGTEFQIEYGPIFSPSVHSLPPGRALLFLKKVNDANSYSVVTAKFIQKDAVFQLVQVGNPGPLGLTPQKPENIKLITGQKYGETELIQDLLIALKKADSLTNQFPNSTFPEQAEWRGSLSRIWRCRALRIDSMTSVTPSRVASKGYGAAIKLSQPLEGGGTLYGGTLKKGFENKFDKAYVN